MVQRTTGQVGWGQAPKGSICRPGPRCGRLGPGRPTRRRAGPRALAFGTGKEATSPARAQWRREQAHGATVPLHRGHRGRGDEELGPCMVSGAEILGGHASTRRPWVGGLAAGAWVQSACVLCPAVPQWGRWGSGEFGRLVNRNAAQTTARRGAARRGRPTPPWASGPAPWRRGHNSSPPALLPLPGRRARAGPSPARSHCWRLLAAAASLPAR